MDAFIRDHITKMQTHGGKVVYFDGSPGLTKIIGGGSFGKIFATTDDNIVAKVEIMEPDDIAYHNRTLAKALENETIRSHLPFNGIPVELQKWLTYETYFAVLFMEKLKDVSPLSSLQNEANMVTGLYKIMNALADMHLYFPDMKHINIMQRGKENDDLVLVDLDSFSMFDSNRVGKEVAMTFKIFKNSNPFCFPEDESHFNILLEYCHWMAYLLTLTIWFQDTYEVYKKLLTGPTPSLRDNESQFDLCWYHLFEEIKKHNRLDRYPVELRNVCARIKKFIPFAFPTDSDTYTGASSDNFFSEAVKSRSAFNDRTLVF